MLSLSLLISALAATSSATKLYVSSYTGTITTLSLSNQNGAYNLAKLDTNNNCQPNASWLHLDAKHENLFCLDEGIIVANGSVNSFKVNKGTGVLKLVKRMSTLAAPVNSVLYTSSNGSQLLTVAHYTTALTTYKVDSDTGSFTLFQTLNFTMTKPGPHADRQMVPHPHQVLVDPSNKYLVVPDLGADLVRVFYVDPATLALVPRTSIPVVPGSGPRHGRFLTKGGSTFYYLVTEIGSTLSGYKVTSLPNNGGLNMTLINDSKTYGNGNATVFAGSAAAEINITPNGKSIIVSNRNATYTTIANPDPKNATMIPSDSLAHFSISGGNGQFVFDQLSPAGGSFPRHMSENHDGTLMAVGLQLTGRVVIYAMDKELGTLGTKVLADFEGLGNVTSIVWA